MRNVEWCLYYLINWNKFGITLGLSFFLFLYEIKKKIPFAIITANIIINIKNYNLSFLAK